MWLHPRIKEEIEFEIMKRQTEALYPYRISFLALLKLRNLKYRIELKMFLKQLKINL